MVVKIQIKGLRKPTVWRRIMVSGDYTFFTFHHVIQASFGWENSHLYQFSPKGYGSEPQIGMVDPQWQEEGLLDARKTKLKTYLNKKGQKFNYLYDFGDNWEHQITVEEVTHDKIIIARLLDGQGACPPEDGGGFPGYGFLLETLADPSHPEHLDTRSWLGLRPGMRWDPKYFNLEEASAELESMF